MGRILLYKYLSKTETFSILQQNMNLLITSKILAKGTQIPFCAEQFSLHLKTIMLKFEHISRKSTLFFI